MSDQPITLALLAKFHRDVIVPDIQRIVGEAVSGAEGRLRNEAQGLHDSVLDKLCDIETETAAIKMGLRRIEEGLAGVEVRVGALEGRLAKVEKRVERLATALRRFEERLRQIKARIDGIPEPPRRLGVEVQQLKAAIGGLQGRIGALERRAKR